MSLALYASPIEETKELPKSKINKQKTRKHRIQTKTKEDLRENNEKNLTDMIRKLHSDDYQSDDSDSESLEISSQYSKKIEDNDEIQNQLKKRHLVYDIPTYDHDEQDIENTNYYSFDDRNHYAKSNHNDHFTYKENFSNMPQDDDFDHHLTVDELSRKMDYIIHMLKDNEQGKSGYVIEELILYCFLGIFMIYVIDSFVKVGKYTR